ncbi:MAG: hypothetical protein K2I78_02700, partial [Clostridia bacterium]|nr:hypothetical protein [Clostridia bacterium]
MDIRKRKIKGIFVLSVLIILCLCVASVLNMFALERKAEAVSSGAATTNIGDLLIKNYENNSKKFDRDKLDKLYAQITGIENATYANVLDAAEAIKTSENFRSSKNTQTGGKLITFTMLGMDWNAVYLSKNNSGEPILTVWQANSNVTAQWNYHADNADANIPSSMYSTSMIRNIALNAGGTYYTSNDGSGATPVPQDSGHTYAKFTMNGVTGSLTSFIDKPASVGWQANEISHTVNGYEYDFNNDAYGDVGSGGGSNANWNSGMVNYYGKTDYSAWKDDYIWLPSMTESGWTEGNYIANGIWNTSTAERGNSGGDSWLRSSVDNYYSNVYTLLADGSVGYYRAANSSSFTVRPAFHLNLAKVENASAKSMTSPQDVEVVYTGDAQGVDSKYTQDFLDNVDIKYYDKGSTTPRSTKPTAVGNYTVKYTLNDKYYWSDKLDGAERTKSFKITPRRMDYPTFDNGKYSLQKSYAGDADISFTLDN